jgi:hypothetical protein
MALSPEGTFGESVAQAVPRERTVGRSASGVVRWTGAGHEPGRAGRLIRAGHRSGDDHEDAGRFLRGQPCGEGHRPRSEATRCPGVVSVPAHRPPQQATPRQPDRAGRTLPTAARARCPCRWPHLARDRPRGWHQPRRSARDAGYHRLHSGAGGQPPAARLREGVTNVQISKVPGEICWRLRPDLRTSATLVSRPGRMSSSIFRRLALSVNVGTNG